MIQSSPNNSNMKGKIKEIVGQYKNTMEYVKIGNPWKQNKYIPIVTELSVLKHIIYYTFKK